MAVETLGDYLARSQSSSFDEMVNAGLRAIFGSIANARRRAGADRVYHVGEFSTKATGIVFGGYAESYGTERDDDTGEFIESQRGAWRLTWTQPLPHSVRLATVERMRGFNGDCEEYDAMLSGSWCASELADLPAWAKELSL